MYSTILGYLVGKARMQGQAFDLLRALRYDSGRSFFEVTPELSRMLYVSDYVRKYRLDTKEQIAAFVSELSFLERNSEYLPLYLLPIAFAPTTDALNTICAVYETAKSLICDKRIIEDCVITVAVIRWSIKKLGDTESYLNRLLDRTQDDGTKTVGSDVAKAIEIGLSHRDYVAPVYGTIGRAMLRAAVLKGNHPDIQAAIAATVAEYNHEQLGFYEMTSNMSGFSEESSSKDIAQEEFPLKKTVQCRTWDGQLLKGYKRMDGYYSWKVKHKDFECYLIGTKEKPFDKELVLWRWFEAHWEPQSIAQTIEKFAQTCHYTEKYRLNWFNKFIYVPVDDDELIIDFKHCRFEMNVCLNSVAFDYYVESHNEVMSEMDNEESQEATVTEHIFDEELTATQNNIRSYGAYLAAHRYGGLRWTNEKITELTRYMTDYEFQFYFLPALLRQEGLAIGGLTVEHIQKALKQKGQQYDCSNIAIKNEIGTPVPHILFSFPKEKVVSPCAFYAMALIHQGKMKYFTFEKGDGTNFFCQVTECNHINIEDVKEDLTSEDFSECVFSHLNGIRKSLFDDFWGDD